MIEDRRLLFVYLWKVTFDTATVYSRKTVLFLRAPFKAFVVWDRVEVNEEF